MRLRSLRECVRVGAEGSRRAGEKEVKGKGQHEIPELVVVVELCPEGAVKRWKVVERLIVLAFWYGKC